MTGFHSFSAKNQFDADGGKSLLTLLNSDYSTSNTGNMILVLAVE